MIALPKLQSKESGHVASEKKKLPGLGFQPQVVRSMEKILGCSVSECFGT